MFLTSVEENRNAHTAAVQKYSFVFPLQRNLFTKILSFLYVVSTAMSKLMLFGYILILIKISFGETFS